MSGLIVSFLLTQSSIAQIYDGTSELTSASTSSVLGELLVTGATPPPGLAQHTCYWPFASTSWPDFAFVGANVIDFSGSMGQEQTAVARATFPATPSHNLPASIPVGDRFYEVAICSSGLTNCTTQAYLWVDTGTDRLRWFGTSAIPSSGLISPAANQVLHFDPLSTVPSGGATFRYLQQGPL